MTADIPVFVISLRDAVDRRELSARAWRSIGIEPRILDAIDGSRPPDGFIDSYSRTRSLFTFGRGLTVGEIAIVQSHARACAAIVDSGQPIGIIAEDDAEPDPRLVSILEAATGAAPPWDIITLHSMFAWSDPVPIDGPELPGGHRLVRYERTPLGAQGYVITRAAARRVLELTRQIRMPIDELLFREHPAHLCVYGIAPNPVTERSTDSELQKRRASPDEHGVAPRGALEHLLSTSGRIDFRVRRRLRRWQTSFARSRTRTPVPTGPSRVTC